MSFVENYLVLCFWWESHLVAKPLGCPVKGIYAADIRSAGINALDRTA